MKHFLFLIMTISIMSCNSSSSKKEKDLEIKELELKKQEQAMLDQKKRDLDKEEQRLAQERNRIEKLNKTNQQSTNNNGQRGLSANNTRREGLYPVGSERYLTTGDLTGLSGYTLKIMRNEIFARHGYIFKTADMIDYFSTQGWYHPLYNDVNNKLTSVEKYNIEFIKKFEQ